MKFEPLRRTQDLSGFYAAIFKVEFNTSLGSTDVIIFAELAKVKKTVCKAGVRTHC